MQFRERRRVIQVIRTTYDPGLKRGRAEVVGRIDKATLAPTEKLLRDCSADEAGEVWRYLAERSTSLHDEAVRAGAETLPRQIRVAAEYFRDHSDEDARRFAAEIRAAWTELKAAIRKAGFTKEALADLTPPPRRRPRATAEPPGDGDAPESPQAAPAKRPRKPKTPATPSGDG